MVSDGNLSAPSLSLLTPGTGRDQAQHFISGTVSICIHSTLCHLHWPHMLLLSSLYCPSPHPPSLVWTMFTLNLCVAGQPIYFIGW